MRIVPSLLRAIAIPMLAGWVILPAAVGTFAQDRDEELKPLVVTPAEVDQDAARESKVLYRKAWSGHKAIALEKSKLAYRAAADQHANRAAADQQAAAAKAAAASAQSPVRYPGDLDNNGGTVVEFAASHDIYMRPNGNCPISTCWGNPEQFLRDFASSEMIHITDQYVGQRSSNRYTLGRSASVSFTPSATTPLLDSDIQAVVHAVASRTGQTGYRHIYHVFVPKGQDVCTDSTRAICASNTFCAYHSSVDFQDIGHVLYSVDPYANVQGCQVRPGTPNGMLADSTNDNLAHELLEVITDPDGTAWWNITGLGMLGEEIGDECVFVLFVGTMDMFSDPAIISLNGRKYALQPEYNNRVHGCSLAP